MSLVPCTDGYHDPTCSGCPHCSELAAAILKNPHNPVLISAMGNTRLRRIAEEALRTTCQCADDTDTNDRDKVPDAWSGALAKRACAKADAKDESEQLSAMRAFRESVLGATTTSRQAADHPATSETHLQPPNPYPPPRLRRRQTIEYGEVGGAQRPIAIYDEY